MKKISTVIVLLCSLLSLAKSNFSIQGFFSNIDENTPVMIRSYENYEHHLDITYVKSGTCEFQNIPALKEGVYQIIVNHPVDQFNKKETFFFDIIKINSENAIKFSFNPQLSYLPSIIESEINKNWYQYLKTLNFKLNVIHEVQNLLANKSELSINQNINHELAIENEIHELKNWQENYVNQNFNKWTTFLAKNTTVIIELEKNLLKENYWSCYDAMTKEYLNTPILQDAIHFYIKKYYNSATSYEYQKAFLEIINHFTNKPEIQEWIGEYILYKLKQNNAIISYSDFSTSITKLMKKKTE